MCGICGWLNVKRQLNTATIEKMNNIAKHRGPDDEGYMMISAARCDSLKGKDSCKNRSYDGDISDYNDLADKFLVMGHRRLSIIDLSSDGHQPMTNDDDNLCITFNGEIYNYIELREELVRKGCRITTQTDTEVILNAYMVWGEKCVEHFNGMWGLAIWDSKNHKLFCSRDRLGAKPFYYCIKEGEFIFSSELKQICQYDGVSRLLNESVFVTQIMWGISDFSEETLIKDIYALPGGFNIVISLDSDDKNIVNIDRYQYWDIDTATKEPEIENIVFKTLEDAIHIRTRSDAPLGVLLSGGLDSSCIVAEIADYYEKQGRKRDELNTFTSCYNGFEEGNEQAFASLVNKHCGTRQNFIFPDEMDTFELLEELVWHLEGDSGFSVLGSYQLLKEISKKGIKVLINGQGADETQFGYERYYAYYLKDLIKKIKLKKFLLTFKEASDNSRLSAKMLIQYFVYFSSISVRKYRCLNRMRACITAETKKQFKNNDEVNKYINSSNMKELQYNELRGTQLSHILRMDDRLYMSQSLESRVPFIDYRYVESAVKIPENRKIQNGYTKYLLRKHFEKKLPTEIIWRKNKMGWPSPKKRWVERFDVSKVNDLFENSKLKKYFNIEELKRIYKNAPESYPIEKFMQAELFVRKFDVEVPR